MRFFFLTFIVGLTASILSVTAKRPNCSPPGGICVTDSNCCESNDTCNGGVCELAASLPTRRSDTLLNAAD
ncbi:uncharacterized protein HD556DRAFT_855638 [Suillus plorans]|uniref:Uncharacterized protein n=1 Tax=Suillus plorans TaxID=116603 RepID=A0A9P7DCK3_9AGAM|nr:uncharacterized protein HD556DRAFT_855638 [Suillus plorans]KAG1788580.1 hypothetical protein HD556DRAFT_855638 [Suillus plorans]